MKLDRIDIKRLRLFSEGFRNGDAAIVIRDPKFSTLYVRTTTPIGSPQVRKFQISNTENSDQAALLHGLQEENRPSKK